MHWQNHRQIQRVPNRCSGKWTFFSFCRWMIRTLEEPQVGWNKCIKVPAYCNHVSKNWNLSMWSSCHRSTNLQRSMGVAREMNRNTSLRAKASFCRRRISLNVFFRNASVWTLHKITFWALLIPVSVETMQLLWKQDQTLSIWQSFPLCGASTSPELQRQPEQTLMPLCSSQGVAMYGLRNVFHVRTLLPRAATARTPWTVIMIHECIRFWHVPSKETISIGSIRNFLKSKRPE